MKWMLDTNAVSDLLRSNAGMRQRLSETEVGAVCLSAVTAGELHYGLAKRRQNRSLHNAVHQLLLRIPIAAWTNDVAETYGTVRAKLESAGRPLAALDTMIAAHAHHLGVVLVSNDRAFQQVPELIVESWRD